jgi:copper chaperone
MGTTISFKVQDMSCGHCVRSITEAVLEVDPQAKVDIDLGAKRVQIEPVDSNAQALGDAIREAGFTPVPA